MPLTPKQRHFCQEYLVDLNGTKAAVRAGYSRPSAYNQGGRLMRNDEVRAEIARLQADRATRLALDVDYVLTGLMREAQDRSEGASHSARVRALELLGRHLGLFRDKPNGEAGVATRPPAQVVVYLPDNGRTLERLMADDDTDDSTDFGLPAPSG